MSREALAQMGWALGTTAALAASIWFARRAIKTAISDEFDEDETAI